LAGALGIVLEVHHEAPGKFAGRRPFSRLLTGDVNAASGSSESLPSSASRSVILHPQPNPAKPNKIQTISFGFPPKQSMLSNPFVL
jgi:hypothetical protein